MLVHCCQPFRYCCRSELDRGDVSCGSVPGAFKERPLWLDRYPVKVMRYRPHFANQQAEAQRDEISWSRS